MNGRLFETIKPDGEKRLVGLYKHKNKKSYTFVNLTTGNITPCLFSSPEEAVKDLNRYVREGRLKSYKEVSAVKLVENYFREKK